SRGLVVLPARADEIAARHRFDQYRLEALHHNRTSGYLISLVRRNDVLRVDTGRVVGQDVSELLQPEFGELGQDLPLAGYGIIKDDVESGDPVGRHDQQLVVADRVHVAYLAAPQQGQRFDGGLMKGLRHDVSLK